MLKTWNKKTVARSYLDFMFVSTTNKSITLISSLFSVASLQSLYMSLHRGVRWCKEEHGRTVFCKSFRSFRSFSALFRALACCTGFFSLPTMIRRLLMNFRKPWLRTYLPALDDHKRKSQEATDSLHGLHGLHGLHCWLAMDSAPLSASL